MKTKTILKENAPTVKAGQTLTARSACDYDTIFECKVLSRTKSMATVLINREEKRCKIYVMNDGSCEYIKPMGSYSMAPIFCAK